MLGVVIGLASVVAMVGLEQGMRAQIVFQTSSLGSKYSYRYSWENVPGNEKPFPVLGEVMF